jgi:hypothetical protein
MNFYGEVLPLPARGTEPWWGGVARTAGSLMEQALSSAGGITYWALGQEERGPHEVGLLGGLTSGVAGAAAMGRAVPAVARLYMPLVSQILGPRASPVAATAFAAAVLSTAATGLAKSLSDWLDTFAPDLPREERRNVVFAVLESLPWLGRVPWFREAVERLAARGRLGRAFAGAVRMFTGVEPEAGPRPRPESAPAGEAASAARTASQRPLQQLPYTRVAGELPSRLPPPRVEGAIPTGPPSAASVVTQVPTRPSVPTMGAPPPFTEEQLAALAPRPQVVSQAVRSEEVARTFAPRTIAGAHAHMERLINERVLARSRGTEPYRELAMRAANDPEIANWFRRIYGIDPRSDLGIARLVAIIQDYSRHEFRQLMRE